MFVQILESELQVLVVAYAQDKAGGQALQAGHNELAELDVVDVRLFEQRQGDDLHGLEADHALQGDEQGLRHQGLRERQVHQQAGELLLGHHDVLLQPFEASLHGFRGDLVVDEESGVVVEQAGLLRIHDQSLPEVGVLGPHHFDAEVRQQQGLAAAGHDYAGHHAAKADRQLHGHVHGQVDRGNIVFLVVAQ
jgi:hypothetical protein